MRLALCLILFATPALAWKTTLGPVCVLATTTSDAEVELTYDPSGPLYSITITRLDAPWTAAPVFSMRFDGPQANEISTNRHVLGQNGAALTVTDRGFGNVLNGLEFNSTATAFSGAQQVIIPLDGAAPEVQKFRNCAAAPVA